ncbi:MAG: hypothetical protein JWN82_1 [Candidatus Saccharibacteria bacterium]|nr:hypothetical protein [Candidatus Saccharibacteria bacterium]
MEAHLPILKYGWTDTAREVTKRGITKLILWDAQKAESCGSGTRGERGNMKGESLELLTDLLLGYTGLDGISAMTSSARQDGYPNLIEGKAYRWDVTAVSNGATIPAGEYRIQVKSDDSSMDGYHPEIARVNGPSTLGVYAQEWGAITDLCMQAASTSIGGVASGDIVHVQERLLERLTLAGPVVVLP